MHVLKIIENVFKKSAQLCQGALYKVKLYLKT